MTEDDWLTCMAIVRATWPHNELPTSTRQAWFAQWGSYPAVTPDDVAEAIAGLATHLDHSPTLAQLKAAAEVVYTQHRRAQGLPELPQARRDPKEQLVVLGLMTRALLAGPDDPVRRLFEEHWRGVYDPVQHRVAAFSGERLVDALTDAARQHPEWVGRRTSDGLMATDLVAVVRPASEEAS